MNGFMNLNRMIVFSFAVAIFFSFTQSTFSQDNSKMLQKKVTAAVSSRYYANNVNVSTIGDGWVDLTGQVKSLYDKDRIYEIASHVHGVKKITNDINVVASTTPGNTNANMLPSDMIKQNILYSIKMDAAITQPQNIKVNVDNHLVILSGKVDFYREKLLAETLASQVLGVDAIQNDIKVVPVNKAFSDSDIKAALESVLLNEFPLVNGNNINITVNNGLVTVSGKVSSLWEKNNIEDEFSSVAGVKSVIDNLEVNPGLNS